MTTIIFKSVLLACLPLMIYACDSCSSRKRQATDIAAVVAQAPIAAGTSVQATPIEGYFLKNTYEFDSDTAYFVFLDEASVGAYLGIGKTMGNAPALPSFQENAVAAIALRPTDIDTKIRITQVDVEGGLADIHFTVERGKKLPYTMQPVAFFYFPKPADLHTVNFYEGAKLVEEFQFDLRTAGAPANIGDLLANYMGTYSGVLPCADCEGIETSLTLLPDYKYKLKRVYLGKGNGKTHTEKGKWEASEDLALIELDPDKEESIFFALVDPMTIEKLDNKARPIKSTASLKLYKK